VMALFTSKKTLDAGVTAVPARWPALSPLCHVYAWLVPAVLTVTALLTHNVESDELTSVCLPGASFSDEGILYFILIPESVQLFLSCLFYLIGVVTALVYKSTIEQADQQRCNTKKSSGDIGLINSLRCRMGIFGIFYTLPKLCSFVTVVYEYTFRSLWLVSSQAWLPNMEIFMLRIFMFLFVGMSCLWWIWRKEVVGSWANCCSGCGAGGGRSGSSSPAPGMWGAAGAPVKAVAANPPANLYPDVAYHVQTQQIDSSVPMIPNHCYRL